MEHKISKYLLGLLFYIAMVFMGVDNLKCQSKIIYENASLPLSISSELEIFNDKQSSFTVHQIINREDSLFEKPLQQIPAYSFTKSTIWCKFQVNNITGEPCFLEISPPILNEVVLYQVFTDRIDSVYQGSFYVNEDNKSFRANNYVFSLDSEAKYYLLRVKSKARLFIKAQLGTYLALMQKTRKVDTIHGIYAGLIFMIFVYNLFLFFTNRENIYLFYLLHIINSAVFFLYVSGYGIEFIWKDFPIINSYFITVISFGFILTLVFVMNFLDTKKNLPIVHKALLGVFWVLFANGLMDMVGFSRFAGKLLNYIGFAAMLLTVYGTIKLTKRGFKPAYTFLYAWLLYLVGIAIQTMQSLNYIPTNDITSNTIQIGSAFEIVLLSMAVGNKINFYKEKRLEAMAGEKVLLQEKKVLKNNQKEQLELRLQEQTETLYAKNRELKRRTREIKLKHKEISIQSRKIAEYHDLLEAKNKIIMKQHEDLMSHKENLEQIIEERTCELKEATLRAEKADQLKTAFLRDFSHEIRTPMNAIAGFSSLLVDIDMDDKSHDYYTEIIINHTNNLLDLIDNIVDLSRIQTNNLYLKKVKFDPGKMFTGLLEKFNEKMKREKKSFINLRLDVPGDKNLRLNLDYKRFWKIVYQLIDNSVKYTDAGYIEFGFLQKKDHDIEVFVIDTGVGIKKEKLAYVFDSFRKIERHKAKLQAGTGLGLSLVKGLVTLMRGEIIIDTISSGETLDSQTGTTIKVLIPDAIV